MSNLVTIYMPTRNRVNLLERAVESVLNQTYKNIELIVVDDGSDDNTLEYLDAISRKDSRLRFFCNYENKGACFSRNLAINNAKGEYITGLDDDDYFLPDRVRELVNFYEGGSYNVVYTNFLLKKKKLLKKIKRKKSCSYNDLLVCNHIGNQIFTKTEYIRQVGGFDANFMIWQDLDCWLRILAMYGKAENNGEYSYVVDVSHDSPRITLNNFDKIKKSYNLIVDKNCLAGVDRKKLEMHFLSRDDINFDLKKLISLYKIKCYLIPTKVFIKKSIKKIFYRK